MKARNTFDITMLCLIVGMGSGAAIGAAGDAVKEIAAEVSPWALGLFAAAFISAVLISLVKKNHAALKAVGIVGAMIFCMFFITQFIPVPGADAERLATGLRHIAPWAAVALRLLFLAASFA